MREVRISVWRVAAASNFRKLLIDHGWNPDIDYDENFDSINGEYVLTPRMSADDEYDTGGSRDSTGQRLHGYV